MSASTWSWFLRQNEHLGISTTSRRMIPVWRGGRGSQDPRKFNVPPLIELGLCGSTGHRRMLPLGTKRWLAPNGHWSHHESNVEFSVSRSPQITIWFNPAYP